ncbi:MAG TPA: ABC transporter substrate-binding protein [Pseudorhodoferax sp.]|nr:ABC transporter substrate-binding protein [Pseudorhodoferax sp.]
MKRLALSALAAALYAALCAALPAQALDGKPAVDRNTLVVALPSGPGNLDPLIPPSIDSAKFAWNSFDTLYGFDREGRLEPRLATAHQVGEGGLVHRFTLRRGVKFHNGDAFTAEDVKFSMERVLAPETKSTRRPFFANTVASVEAPDAQTVVFRLKQKDGAFLNKLAGYLYIVPKAYLESLKTPEAFAQAPVGTGPYRIVGHQIGRSLEFARFDGFWGDKPAIAKLVYRFVPEPSSRVNALLAGEADVGVEIAPADIERLADAKGLATERVAGGSPLHIRIYSNDPATPLSRPQVRLALNYAVDKDAIIQSVLRGQAAPLGALIPSSYPYGVDATLKPFAYDPARAKKLLAEAGLPNGFETALTCPTTQPRAICEALAAYWGQVGIRTQIKVIDSAAYNRLNAAHQSGPLVVMGFGNAIYDPIHVVGGTVARNGTWSDYFNPEVEALIQQVEGESDRGRRDALFRQILRLARDDGQAVLLAEPQLGYLRDTALQWQPQAAGWNLDFRSARWK